MYPIILLIASLFSSPPADDYQWGTVKIGGGGYVTGITIHPRDKNVMYIRTDVGGAYRWDPKGNQWIQMLNWIGPDQANLIGVDGMALDPNKPDRIYLALGKSIGGNGGIYRSEDRGNTWKKLMSANYEGNGRVARWTGECIAVDPHSSKVIYAGTRRKGLWRSTNDGADWSKVADVPDGIVKTNGPGVRSILFDPAEKINGQSSTIYAGIPGTGIFQSTNGGESFSLMNGSPVHPARMQVVNRDLFVTHATGVSVWSDGKWNDITPTAGKNYVGLAVDQSDNNKVVVAQRYGSFYNPIYRSVNKGKSWQQINTTESPSELHVTIPWWSKTRFSSATAGMAFSPDNSGELYYTDWFGVWQTPNIWSHATKWNTLVKGHEETVILTLVSPPSGPLVYSGMADNFGFAHDNVDEYPKNKLYNDHEGFSIAYCEKKPAHIAILGCKTWGGAETKLATSDNYGKTWTDRKLPEGTTLGRIAISATDPGKMIYIAGGGSVYYTADHGDTWKTASGAPETPVGKTDIWNKDFSVAADGEDNTFYIFKDGLLYASIDDGATWQVRNSTPIPKAMGFLYVNSTPGKKAELWISLDRNGLWRTIDGGKTFSRVETVGEARLFTWGAAAPRSPNLTAYCYGTVGGKWGLYRSLDLGKHWQRINDDEHQFPSGAKTIAGDRNKFGRIYIGTGGCGVLYGEPAVSKAHKAHKETQSIRRARL